MTMTPIKAGEVPALATDADSLQALYDMDSAYDPNAVSYSYEVIYDAAGAIAAATSVTLEQATETTTTRHFDADGNEKKRSVRTPDWVENYADGKLTDITVHDDVLSITEWVDGAGKPTKSVLFDKDANEAHLTIHQNGQFGPFTRIDSLSDWGGFPQRR